MKKIIAILLVIQAGLIAFFGGSKYSDESDLAASSTEVAYTSTYDTTGEPSVISTEFVDLKTTIPTEEFTYLETTVCQTESITIETIQDPTETLSLEATFPTDGHAEEIYIVVTEPTEYITEPSTEPEVVYGELRSLGVFTLTAYCSCQKCCGQYALNRPVDSDGNEIVYGASGKRLEAGVSIAVDPRVIPYGTQVIINGHTYTAHDTGGGIKGNRIDVYFMNHQEAWNFGLQTAEVFIYA